MAGGPAVLAVAFAAIGVVGALVAFAFALLQQRAEVREDWQALRRRLRRGCAISLAMTGSTRWAWRPKHPKLGAQRLIVREPPLECFGDQPCQETQRLTGLAEDGLRLGELAEPLGQRQEK